MAVSNKEIRALLRGSKNTPVDFYELVRRIEMLASDKPRIGYADSASDEAVRFGQTPALHSDANTVASVSDSKIKDVIALIKNYPVGLLGPDGPLPLEMTLYVLQRSNNYYDYALEFFLDIIHHRFISLYYRAFAQNSLTFSYDREKDDLIGSIVRSLSGTGLDAQFSLPAYAPAAMASCNISKVASATGLKRLLKSFFNQPIEVIENVFSGYAIPNGMYCRLGRRENAVLGLSAQIGSHFYSKTKKFSLSMGPMDFADCVKMLPGSVNYRYLNQIVTFYLQQPLDYDLSFILRKKSLKPIALNGTFALGRSTFFTYADENGTCTLTINASGLQSAHPERRQAG